MGTNGSVWVDGIGCGAVNMLPGNSGVKSKAVLSQFIGKTATRELMFARVQLNGELLPSKASLKMCTNIDHR